MIRMEWKLDTAIEKIDHLADKLEQKYPTRDEVKIEQVQIKDRIKNNDDRLDKIEGILAKLVWTALSPLIVAIVYLVIK